MGLALRNIRLARGSSIILLFLLTTCALFSFRSAEGTIIIGRDGTGTVTCNMLDQSTSGMIAFSSIGKSGDFGFDGSYSIDSNSSFASNGGITNVNSMNRTSNLYNLTYEGEADNCPPTGTTFNSTIIGSCGQNASVKFISNVITGEFIADVKCMD